MYGINCSRRSFSYPSPKDVTGLLNSSTLRPQISTKFYFQLQLFVRFPAKMVALALNPMCANVQLDTKQLPAVNVSLYCLLSLLSITEWIRNTNKSNIQSLWELSWLVPLLFSKTYVFFSLGPTGFLFHQKPTVI